MDWRVFIVCAALAVVSLSAQSLRSAAGTVTSVDTAGHMLAFQPDSGDRQVAEISQNTVLQRVAAGEKDLKKAEPIQFGDIAPGDRVLVTLEAGGAEARRIILMSAKDIGSRNEAERRDWTERGIAGIVSAKNGNQITLRVKEAGSERTAVVTVNDRTAFKRYAPDSVRFSDARASKLQEIQAGDQLRARGVRSSDNSAVTAEDVVFGTFLTRAGSVTAVDPNTKEVRITEIGTGKALVVRLMADTQIKAMPDFGGGSFSPPGALPASGPPDPAQMIERMPLAGIEAIQPGQTIVVSSTKGATPDQITAIVVVANARMLIQMASRQGSPGQTGAGRGGQGGGAGLNPGAMGDMGGGLGFDLSGLIPR